MIANIKRWGVFWFVISGSLLIYKYKKREIKELLIFLLQGKKENKKRTEAIKHSEGKKKDNETEIRKKENKENKENEEEIRKKGNKENDESSSDEKELTDVEDINQMNDRSNYQMVHINRKKGKEKIFNGARKHHKIDDDEEEEVEEEIKKNCKNHTEDNLIIPENYKIFFKSFGCAHNSSDSEFMMGLLSNYGFQFVNKVENCDICIINSCTVKNPSEESMKTIINYVKKLNGNEGTNKKKNNNNNNNIIDNKRINKSSLLYIKKKGEGCDSDYLSTSSGCSDSEEAFCEKNYTTMKNVVNGMEYETSEQNMKTEISYNLKNEKSEKRYHLTESEMNRENEMQMEKKREIKREKKKTQKTIKLIVCGCVPQAEKDMEIFENISLVGVSNIDKIIEVVEHVINGYNVRYLKMNKKMTSLNLPKIRKNKYIEIININNGCLGNCTYCKTKFARGNLLSYNIKDIIERIKYVINVENVKEIWLTSEDTGAYGIDIKTNIVELLKEILKTVDKTNVMIRLGMTNPPYILTHIENICELLKHKNMYEFIHIPVQSGSNHVLKNMKREYTIEDFIYLVDNLRKHVPNITIATDIICGFPYETEEDHKETIELIKKYHFPILNISQFYPRSGTVAFNMKRINTQIVKKRSKEVTDTFLSYNNNFHFLIDTLQNVLYTEISSRSEHLIGHTKQYVKVLLSNQNNTYSHLLGQTVLCKIVAIHKWHVLAELCNTTEKLYFVS